VSWSPAMCRLGFGDNDRRAARGALPANGARQIPNARDDRFARDPAQFLPVSGPLLAVPHDQFEFPDPESIQGRPTQTHPVGRNFRLYTDRPLNGRCKLIHQKPVRATDPQCGHRPRRIRSPTTGPSSAGTARRRLPGDAAPLVRVVAVGGPTVSRCALWRWWPSAAGRLRSTRLPTGTPTMATSQPDRTFRSPT
jgi:hypothetical protein